MTHLLKNGLALAVGATFGLGVAAAAMAQDKKIVDGVMCDRTGATQIVGTVLCPAMHDYFNLINSEGGIDGYKIEHPEIDMQYKVPPAVEAYERFKQQGAVVLIDIWHAPDTCAQRKA